jgi:hypothetical protein
MTVLTTIEVLEKADELGLKLGFEPPFTLTFEPIDSCSPDFIGVLSLHKPQLLALLRLPLVVAYSRIFEETIFLCEDNDTGAALVEAGADESSIYTGAELEILIAHNRAKPFIPAELIKLHAIKKTFGAKLTR